METVLKEYLKVISDNLRVGNATERTHRSALEELLQSIKKGITTTKLDHAKREIEAERLFEIPADAIKQTKL